MKKVRLFDTSYPGCKQLPDMDDDIKSTHIIADSINKNMPKQIPPPPFEFPKHLLNMDVPVGKKQQTVTQKDAPERITFDEIEDGSVTIISRRRQGDSAPTPQQLQKLKTTSKPVKIADLNAVLTPQYWGENDRKFAPMTTSEALMGRGCGIIVADDPVLAAQRKEFNRVDFANEDPNKELQCTNGIAPLTMRDLVGEMRVINY